MVYVLDGCSFHHAHIQNKQIFKNLPKHMLTLKKTSNQSFLGKNEMHKRNDPENESFKSFFMCPNHYLHTY